MVLKVQMTSATGNLAGKISQPAGFSLIEIVLVLGLIALTVAVMITNLAALANRGDTLTTEETLLAAVRKGTGEPEIAYRVMKSVPLVPTPIAVEGRLFLWSDAGVVTCVRLETGEQLWQKRVGGNYFGSPVAVGRTIYCIDKTGTVVVIAADSQFELLGKTSLGEPSFATPAVANGVMYLRTATKLFSLGRDRDRPRQAVNSSVLNRRDERSGGRGAVTSKRRPR